MNELGAGIKGRWKRQFISHEFSLSDRVEAGHALRERGGDERSVRFTYLDDDFYASIIQAGTNRAARLTMVTAELMQEFSFITSDVTRRKSFSQDCQGIVQGRVQSGSGWAGGC